LAAQKYATKYIQDKIITTLAPSRCQVFIEILRSDAQKYAIAINWTFTISCPKVCNTF